MEIRRPDHTVAHYCQQLNDHIIVVNHDYQRQAGIWPKPAQSDLLETILLGYPIPKISLFQRVDRVTRRVTLEIVDGQQRSIAIQHFFNNQLRISRGQFAGKTYADLGDDQQIAFLEYGLSVDIFVGASEQDIRNIFQRMNSYTASLRAHELRHAQSAGGIKFFIRDLQGLFSNVLVEQLGTFTNQQLLRMDDAEWLTELVMAMENGIFTKHKGKIDKFWEMYSGDLISYPDDKAVKRKMQMGFDTVMNLPALRKSDLAKRESLYSLLLAAIHVNEPVTSLQSIYPLESPVHIDGDAANENLGKLLQALQSPETFSGKAEYVKAMSEATNTEGSRKERFRVYCDALGARSVE